MFDVRLYKTKDLLDCEMCLYESFFDAKINDKDIKFLNDYSRLLIEASNFTYVATNEKGEVVGWIAGLYNSNFDQKIYKKHYARRHVFKLMKIVIKLALERYKLSDEFDRQVKNFFFQVKEKDDMDFSNYDLEILALASKKDYRKGLGTKLLSELIKHAKKEGAKTIKVFTKTYFSYQFYKKKGFKKVEEKSFKNDEENKSLVYELNI